MVKKLLRGLVYSNRQLCAHKIAFSFFCSVAMNKLVKLKMMMKVANLSESEICFLNYSL